MRRGLAAALLGMMGCMSLPGPGASTLVRVDSFARAAQEIADTHPSPPLPARMANDTPTLPARMADDDPLTLAAEAMTRGDDPAAAVHFETYVDRHPDQAMFRLHLADLLLKLKRWPEAQQHYERFIAFAQDSDGPLQEKLVHCHTRLMEIAQSRGDRFAELLHRGIGLVLLTRDAIPDSETREEILCQAIRSLRAAKEIRSDDPRLHAYLAEAQSRAGNRRAAEVSRAAAANHLLPGLLTPHEARELVLPDHAARPVGR